MTANSTFPTALLAAAALALPGHAGGTDFTALSPRERAIFHNEIRETLLGLPQLLPSRSAPVSVPVPDLYADAVASDLARIGSHAAVLFDPSLPGFGARDAALTIALFTAPGCPDCTRAENDLRALAETHDIRVTLLDFTENAALAQSLQLDTAPSYVMPDRMLRGHMPAIVLERYFNE